MLLLLACLSAPSALAESPAKNTPEQVLPKAYATPKYTPLATRLGNGEASLVQVLDVDLKAGKLAFKLVYADQGGVETAAPSNCNYAGMEDTPDAGVTLALFDLNKGTAEQFVVYAVALKPADCTPHAQSTQRLAAAKAAFTAAGLDISKKPAPLKPDAKGNFSFAGDHTVHAWAHDVTAESPEDWARIVGGEADISMGHVDAGLRQGEVVLVADSHTFSRNGAGGAGTDFPLAWQQEDKAVFLVRTWSHDMRSGYDEKWTFTPVISL